MIVWHFLENICSLAWVYQLYKNTRWIIWLRSIRPSFKHHLASLPLKLRHGSSRVCATENSIKRSPVLLWKRCLHCYISIQQFFLENDHNFVFLTIKYHLSNTLSHICFEKNAKKLRICARLEQIGLYDIWSYCINKFYFR